MTEYPYSNDEILTALTNSPVAGKDTYNNDITRSDATTTVSTAGELDDALSAGDSIVWIDDDIDITDHSLDVGVGQTVAGDRGINGSSGPTVYSTDHGETGLNMHNDNARLTGIHLRGPEYNAYDHPDYSGYLPYPDTSYSDEERYDEYYYFYNSCGVNVRGNGIEIDNCEINGWGDMGVNVYEGSWDNSAYIHHCYIHNCMKASMGYGVEIFYARPLIEYCYFNATRHTIAGWGTADSSFIFRNNAVGPHNTSHAVDQHGVYNNVPSDDWSYDYYDDNWVLNAGAEMVVTNNTFFVTGTLDDTRSQVNDRFQLEAHPSSYMEYEVFDEDLHTWDISIRGMPKPRDGEGILIEYNSFLHDGPQASNQGLRSFSYPYSFNQDTYSEGESPRDEHMGSDDFTTNFIHRNNQYDHANKPYDPEYGAPLNMDGAVTADFVVNAITDGGEWKVDGIPNVDVTLTKL